MAHEADRLVDEIRRRRRRLQADVDALVSGNGVATSIRDRPGTWLAGSVLAGLLVGRLWGKPLLRAGKRQIIGPLRSQAQAALAGLVTAAFAGRIRPRGTPSQPAPPAPFSR